MLKSLSVSRYRCFDTYSIDDLGEVNLLVGRNNSGKTSLLEALHILSSDGDARVLFGVTSDRGESLLDPDYDGERTPEPPMDPAFLFPFHDFNVNEPFRIEGINDGATWVEGKFVEDTDLNEDETGSLYEEETSSSSLLFVISSSHKPSQSFRVNANGGITNPFRQMMPVKARHERKPSVFVSTSSLTSNQMHRMWDRVLLAGREADVRNALKILDPQVEDVIFLSSSRPWRSRPVIIRHQEWKEPLPLGSMGEGMKRMLSLALAAIHATNGVLIVDEIDTGLHYSVLADMWKLLIATCRHNSVQLFATTHSADCLDALTSVCQQDEHTRSISKVHRIESSTSTAKTITGDDLIESSQRDLEVR